MPTDERLVKIFIDHLMLAMEARIKTLDPLTERREYIDAIREAEEWHQAAQNTLITLLNAEK